MRTAQLPRQCRGSTEPGQVALTRFLVVLTDVRAQDCGRDERASPERRRQVVGASSRVAAERIAGAFMALGMVRAGRQRVKLIAIGRRRSRR
ncbi:hypothetical protein [Salinispora oceanensis]|uniref:hypothetical protein n=1 Tax=Salinispora oceanensis TaxID=1050199 RepID=UPI00036AA886|nr:hypothetical protein [Salinispora oceanensis]